MSAPRCLVVPHARPRARRRVVLFPHAGGGASFYRGWSELLGPDIELQIVQYPGRETRVAEPLVSELGALVSEATAALCETDDREVDTALFGHSMGAMVAHETALALESQGGVRLTHLFVSGRRAPGGDGRDDPPISTDEDILATVERHGATPVAVLEDPATRAFFLRILRNDYEVVASCRHADGRPVEVDITALWGHDDPQVDGDRIRRWSRLTTGRFRAHVFDGGHFYLVPQVKPVVELVRRQILAGLASNGPGEQTPTLREQRPAFEHVANRRLPG